MMAVGVAESVVQSGVCCRLQQKFAWRQPRDASVCGAKTWVRVSHVTYRPLVVTVDIALLHPLCELLVLMRKYMQLFKHKLPNLSMTNDVQRKPFGN